MTMRGEIREREYDKFQEINGKTIVGVYHEGPIQAELIGATGSPLNVYDDVTNLAKESEATIVTYMVPAGKILYLSQVSASGDNIAIYNLYVNGELFERKRTWWTRFNAEFDFLSYPIGEGIVLELKVIHYRNENGAFNGTIKGVLK